MRAKPSKIRCPNSRCLLAYPPQHEIHKGRYPRIYQRGMTRKWYLHHWVVWRLGGGEPDSLRSQGLEVHHMDFNSMNPCPYNLLIIPREIHQSFRNRTNLGNLVIDKLVVDMILEDRSRRQAYARLTPEDLAEIQRKEP